MRRNFMVIDLLGLVNIYVYICRTSAAANQASALSKFFLLENLKSFPEKSVLNRIKHFQDYRKNFFRGSGNKNKQSYDNMATRLTNLCLLCTNFSQENSCRLEKIFIIFLFIAGLSKRPIFVKYVFFWVAVQTNRIYRLANTFGCNLNHLYSL